LRDKFLRGVDDGYGVGSDGADSRTIPVPLKNHSHAFTGITQTGEARIATKYGPSASGVFSGSSGKYGGGWNGSGMDEFTLKFAMTPAGTIGKNGDSDAPAITVSTIPAYYKVIFIEKIA
jgi:hypothetical protein